MTVRTEGFPKSVSGASVRRYAGTALRLVAGLTVMLLFLLFPAVAARGAVEGLKLCAASVIPALFPFMVLSPMVEYAVRRLILHLCGGRMTEQRAALVSAFAVGMTAGFPVGAVTVASLREQGILTEGDAAAFLGVCSASSPAFLVGYFGRALWNTEGFGWLLWGVQVLVGLLQFAYLIGRTDSFGSQNTVAAAASGMPSLTESLRHASVRMLSLCGTVVFFTVLRAYVCSMVGGDAAAALCGVLEMTGGLRECAAAYETGALSLRTAMVLSGFFVGFGGVCVGMQTAAEAARAHIGMRQYYIQKVCAGILCAVCMGLAGG